METVINHDVRQAAEILSNQWDLEDPNKTMQKLRYIVEDTLGAEGFSFQRGKLNIYGPGGFFHEHQDTPTNSKTMLGTCVICLPTQFTGGELVVKHDDRKEVFDFSKHNGNAQFVVMYSDCPHEVKRVESGYRITLTYYIHNAVKNSDHDFRFHDSPEISQKSDQLDIISNVTSNLFKLNQLGLPLGIILNHKYPVDQMDNIHCLKGSDRSLYDALIKMKAEVHLSPVLLRFAKQWPVEDYPQYGFKGTVYPFTKEHYSYYSKIVSRVQEELPDGLREIPDSPRLPEYIPITEEMSRERIEEFLTK